MVAAAETEAAEAAVSDDETGGGDRKGGGGRRAGRRNSGFAALSVYACMLCRCSAQPASTQKMDVLIGDRRPGFLSSSLPLMAKSELIWHNSTYRCNCQRPSNSTSADLGRVGVAAQPGTMTGRRRKEPDEPDGVVGEGRAR